MVGMHLQHNLSQQIPIVNNNQAMASNPVEINNQDMVSSQAGISSQDMASNPAGTSSQAGISRDLMELLQEARVL